MKYVTSIAKWWLRDGAARAAMAAFPREPWSVVFDGTHASTDSLRAYHAALRDRPVCAGKVGYVATGYSDSKHILANPDFTPPTFQMLYPAWLAGVYDKMVDAGPANPFEYPSMVVVDGPKHRRLRRYLASYFTPRSVAAMHCDIRAIVDTTLEELAQRDDADLVRDFAEIVPAHVSAKLLGFDRDDTEELIRLGDGSVKMLEVGRPVRQFLHLERCIEALDSWVDAQLRLAVRGRRDLSGIFGKIAVDLRNPDFDITYREARSLVSLLILAGFETTVNLIATGAGLLIENPDQLAKLNACPELWPNAINEILRLDGPVLGTVRMAKRDAVLSGTAIAAGTFILVSGANHDSDVFDNPYVFDVERPNAGEHLVFGGGAHFCIGAHLAKTEGEFALKAFFSRFPDVRFKESLVRKESTFLRGWDSIPVSFSQPSIEKT